MSLKCLQGGAEPTKVETNIEYWKKHGKLPKLKKKSIPQEEEGPIVTRHGSGDDVA